MAMPSVPTPVVVARHELTAAVSLFHSLADPTRLAILQRLAGGERRVVDLTADLDLAQSTVS
jgi:ArsR family transcriptional regulator, cadmium/lead-responsive transcriptional repressor